MEATKTCKQENPDCTKCQYDKCTCPYRQEKDQQYEQANKYWETKRMNDYYSRKY